MADDKNSVAELVSTIKEETAKLPTEDWGDTTGVYSYLHILNSSRLLLNSLSDGVIQALDRDPSISSDTVNEIIKEYLEDSRVSNFTPANPTVEVSDKFSDNKVLATDYIYTLITRFNHVLDLLDKMNISDSLVKGIKSVNQNLTLVADKQDQFINIDPALKSLQADISTAKSTASDAQQLATTAKQLADSANSATSQDNLTSLITQLLGSGIVHTDDSLAEEVKSELLKADISDDWSSTENDLSNASSLLLRNSVFGINLLDENGRIVKSYAPEKTEPTKYNYVNIPVSVLGNSSINISDSKVVMDPGSSLQGVSQLWSGSTSVTTGTTVTLSKSLSDVGDGIQLVVQILKSSVSKGVVSKSSTTLPTVFSKDTKAQADKYVCNIPIPISILASDLVVGSTVNVVITGVGEALETTTVSQAPALSIKVVDNKTLFITNYQGFALDKKGADSNGAFYDAQIISINSFTQVKEPPQLPNGTVLYTGIGYAGSREQPQSIILSGGVKSDFSNVGSGIKIYLSDKLGYSIVVSSSTQALVLKDCSISLKDLEVTPASPIKIPKSKLVYRQNLVSFSSSTNFVLTASNSIGTALGLTVNGRFPANLEVDTDAKLNWFYGDGAFAEAEYFLTGTVLSINNKPGAYSGSFKLQLGIAKIESYQD